MDAACLVIVFVDNTVPAGSGKYDQTQMRQTNLDKILHNSDSIVEIEFYSHFIFRQKLICPYLTISPLSKNKLVDSLNYITFLPTYH